jgi:hypothetical protein
VDPSGHGCGGLRTELACRSYSHVMGRIRMAGAGAMGYLGFGAHRSTPLRSPQEWAIRIAVAVALGVLAGMLVGRVFMGSWTEGLGPGAAAVAAPAWCAWAQDKRRHGDRWPRGS